MNRRRMLSLAVVLTLVAAPALAAEKAEKKKGGGESYIQLPTLTASIQRPNGGRGVMTVEVGIDVQDAGLRKRAQESIPLLRDAYTQTMLGYAPSLSPGAPPNPDIISAQLQRATDRALGRPGAKLLIGSILLN
jgi:hypothetical protein